MKIRIALTLFAFALLSTGYGQKLKTRSGMVKFFSEAQIEDIEAVNNQVSSVLNLETGEFAYLVPIKAFVFEKALMQEHFNENYMESGKYPNASFIGSSADLKNLDLSKNMEKKVMLSGKMTIHGVEKEIETPVVIKITDGAVTISSDFTVLASDYNVEIPATKKDNINNELAVTVNVQYGK